MQIEPLQTKRSVNVKQNQGMFQHSKTQVILFTWLTSPVHSITPKCEEPHNLISVTKFPVRAICACGTKGYQRKQRKEQKYLSIFFLSLAKLLCHKHQQLHTNWPNICTLRNHILSIYQANPLLPPLVPTLHLNIVNRLRLSFLKWNIKVTA